MLLSEAQLRLQELIGADTYAELELEVRYTTSGCNRSHSCVLSVPVFQPFRHPPPPSHTHTWSCSSFYLYHELHFATFAAADFKPRRLPSPHIVVMLNLPIAKAIDSEVPCLPCYFLCRVSVAAHRLSSSRIAVEICLSSRLARPTLVRDCRLLVQKGLALECDWVQASSRLPALVNPEGSIKMLYFVRWHAQPWFPLGYPPGSSSWLHSFLDDLLCAQNLHSSSPHDLRNTNSLLPSPLPAFCLHLVPPPCLNALSVPQAIQQPGGDEPHEHR